LLRSRISFCAFSGEFQKSARSLSALSSSRRWIAVSQSKTPPQQGDGRADLFGGGGDIRSHANLRNFEK
jgi:hypothetical protein